MTATEILSDSSRGIEIKDVRDFIELMDTPFGINEVRNIIGRVEHGVYS